MGQQLVRLFGSRVEADGVVHLVVRGIGHLFVAAVHAGRGGVHKMLHRMVAARFQNVVESNDIRFDIGIRVGDRVAHARLRGEIHHHRRLVLLEDTAHKHLVRQIPLDESKIWILRQFCKPVFFQTHVVVIVHAVQADHLRIWHVLKQALYQVRTDEARRAGHQDRLV